MLQKKALGVPDDLSNLKGHSNALVYIKKLPKFARKQMKDLVPTAPPLALDLLDKILTLDPEERFGDKNILFDF